MKLRFNYKNYLFETDRCSGFNVLHYPDSTVYRIAFKYDDRKVCEEMAEKFTYLGLNCTQISTPYSENNKADIPLLIRTNESVGLIPPDESVEYSVSSNNGKYIKAFVSDNYNRCYTDIYITSVSNVLNERDEESFFITTASDSVREAKLTRKMVSSKGFVVADENDENSTFSIMFGELLGLKISDPFDFR